MGSTIKWEHTMRKLNTPFSVSTYPRGSFMGTIVWGYPIPLSTIWYDNGDIYFEKNEIACIRKFLEYKYNKDKKYPSKISRNIFSVVEKMKQQRINTQNINDLNSLVNLLDTNSEYFFKLIGYISFRGAVQMCDVLEEKIINVIYFRSAEINEINKVKDYQAALTLPLYPSVVTEEKIDSLKLAKNFSGLSKDRQKKVINEYIEKYEWLSYHWLVGKPLDTDEIRNKLLSLEKKSDEDLKQISDDKKNQEKEITAIVKRLRFNDEEMRLLKEFRVWIFMRTFIKDNINLAGYKLLPILGKIANKVGLPEEDIVWLTYDEIANINNIKLEEAHKLIIKRKKGFSAGTIGNKLIFNDFSKYNVQNKLQKISKEQNVKGSIAFKGVVKGIVRVVMFPRDQEKLKQGEILVTSMTTPDYLPAMGRASAFVTDEGGITCHAAIIAREMKKPCVIGTKIATKMFKDGDLVEVDANNGTVKILN